MIPYLEIPSLPLPLGGFSIHAFGVLVAIGVILGDRIVVREAARRGLDPRDARWLNAWMVIGGFVMAHLVSVIFYFPERIAENPLWTLINVFSGLSSFGGFAGAFITYLYLSRKAGIPRLAYADSVALGLSVGWIFGRLGCTTAHDHPGRRTDFFLAVAYPEGARHDLGFYELLFTIALTGLLFWYARRPRRAGHIIGLAATAYAPVRFLLDFLRATDVARPDTRYLGLTPAQWACLALLALGVSLLRRKTPLLEFTGPPASDDPREGAPQAPGGAPDQSKSASA